MSVFDPRWSAALALVASCAAAPAEPVAPDVSGLLSAYAAPSGTVDASQPASWLKAAEAQVAALGGGQANLVIAQTAASAFLLVDQSALPSSHDGPVPTRVDGVVTLQVPCGAGANQTADVTVAIVDGTAAQLLWGKAKACPLWQGLGTQATYDGSFTMYRYTGADLLISVDGTLNGGSQAPIHVDFRLYGGRMETRVATPTGDVIATRDGTDVVARAANGTFRCDTRSRACRLDKLD